MKQLPEPNSKILVYSEAKGNTRTLSYYWRGPEDGCVGITGALIDDWRRAMVKDLPWLFEELGYDEFREIYLFQRVGVKESAQL